MLEILYKNKDFIVCVKPQGVPSQSDTTCDEDMTSLLQNYLRESEEKDDIFVVHRLDRATGGVMVYARNKSAAAEFSRLVAEKDTFEKHYLTIVSGIPEEPSGTLTDYLYKDSAQKKAFIVKNERKGSKLASLDYEVMKAIESNEKVFSLISIKLHTGRFHQIRVQFSSRGMPVYGDGKYGSREKAESFALWASKISFKYKGKNYTFEQNPDMTQSPWDILE
jgi:23S rRNA pseudouridine1911/1915/1917 synthase